ncbi:hypothetical protein [Microcystis phage Mwe-JY26]
MNDKTTQRYLNGVAFDGHAAQARNPSIAGTFRDSPQARAERQQKWGQPRTSPLYTPPNLRGDKGKRAEDGAFRR